MAGIQSDYRCLFCCKHNDEVRRMIAGPKGAFICNECVAQASAIIAKEEAEAEQDLPL
jgi:ATP-dependent Clp protease ATP-binding subunit ClpX